MRTKNLGIWLYCLTILGVLIVEMWLLYKIICYVL